MHSVQWVSLGDVVLDSTEYAILSVDHHADNGFHEVTIRLACSSYATADVTERPEVKPAEIVGDSEMLSPLR